MTSIRWSGGIGRFYLPYRKLNISAIVQIAAKFASAHSMKPLVFQGHQYLRQRVLLSVLSGCPIKIEKIRADRPEPGLKGSVPSCLGFLTEFGRL